MKKVKRVLYNVQCAFNPAHVFEKIFTIEEESEGLKSEMEAYCPYCEKHVSITIAGKSEADASILKRFDL